MIFLGIIFIDMLAALFWHGVEFHDSPSGPREASMPAVELITLGTGSGTTALLDGEPSSAFVLRIDGECRLMIDAGLGVTQHLANICGGFPPAIFVSHNHSDHAGELPVIAIVAANKGQAVKVACGLEVCERLKQHRLHEARSAGLDPSSMVDWTVGREGDTVRIDEDIELTLLPARHSEVCYGFLLDFRGRSILGFSGDSGFNAELYDALKVAPTVLVDARENGSEEHAGFDQVRVYLDENTDANFFVYGYGRADQAPAPSLPHVNQGDIMSLRRTRAEIH